MIQSYVINLELSGGCIYYNCNLLLTSTKIHPTKQTSNPRHFALALAVVVDELAEEDAECVGNAVHNHVAHEGGEDNDPAVAAVGRRWYVVVVAVGELITVTGRR